MKSILLLGTNLGNKRNNLKIAIRFIESRIGVIVCKSRLYETEPWGFASTELFYNMVVEVETKLNPQELLKKIKGFEVEMGRKHTSNNCYENRILDLDILFYGDVSINTKELIIPHPKLHLRKFTLIPLNEIKPKYFHPILKKEISTLLIECKDKSTVVNIGYL